MKKRWRRSRAPGGCHSCAGETGRRHGYVDRRWEEPISGTSYELEMQPQPLVDPLMLQFGESAPRSFEMRQNLPVPTSGGAARVYSPLIDAGSGRPLLSGSDVGSREKQAEFSFSLSGGGLKPVKSGSWIGSPPAWIKFFVVLVLGGIIGLAGGLLIGNQQKSMGVAAPVTVGESQVETTSGVTQPVTVLPENVTPTPTVEVFGAAGGNLSIYVVEAEGGSGSFLALGSSPVWSPDGSRIAFNVHDSEGNLSIYVVGAEGGSGSFLALGSGPVWSPDGSRIAFSVQDSEGSLSIYVTGAEGGGGSFLALGSGPVWSPDGSRIAFNIHDPEGNLSIYVVGAEGGSGSFLALGSGPVWSPDGSRIALLVEE